MNKTKGNAWKTLWEEYKLVAKSPSNKGFTKWLVATCWKQKILILELQGK